MLTNIPDYSKMTYAEILAKVLAETNRQNEKYNISSLSGDYLVVLFLLDYQAGTMGPYFAGRGDVVLTNNFMPFFNKYFPSYPEKAGELLPSEIQRHDPRLIRAVLEYRDTYDADVTSRTGVYPWVTICKSITYSIYQDWNDDYAKNNEVLIDDITTIDLTTLV